MIACFAQAISYDIKYLQYTESYSEMADGFSVMVNSVTALLSQEECRTLQYLCTDLFNNSCVEDLRGALLDFAKRNQTCQPQAGDALLMELMFRLKRFDILKKVLGTNRQQVEVILQKGSVLSDYRWFIPSHFTFVINPLSVNNTQENKKPCLLFLVFLATRMYIFLNWLCRVLMADVSDNLAEEDLRTLKFLMNSTLPKERVKKAAVSWHFVFCFYLYIVSGMWKLFAFLSEFSWCGGGIGEVGWSFLW